VAQPNVANATSTANQLMRFDNSRLANRRVRRNVDFKPAATTIQPTRDLDDTTHPRSSLLDDREPQTRTSGIVVPPAVKAIEDPGAVTFQDAGAIIGNGQYYDITTQPEGRQFHHDPPIFIAIADRVIDQVLQHGLQRV
jgi:hypothetical protein